MPPEVPSDIVRQVGVELLGAEADPGRTGHHRGSGEDEVGEPLSVKQQLAVRSAAGCTGRSSGRQRAKKLQRSLCTRQGGRGADRSASESYGVWCSARAWRRSI